jgi:hypothetical protein
MHDYTKKNVEIFAGLFIIIFLFLAQIRSFAWGNTWMGMRLEQVVNSARARAGAFSYNAAFQINNAGYDSDIYFGIMDKPVPDYTFSAGPDLRIFLPVKKRLVFDIADSLRYVFYRKTAEERVLNNTFNGNLHIVFDRFYVQAGAGLVNAKQRLSSELNLNVRLRMDDYSGLLLWQASKETSFALQYQRSKYAYENLTSELTDIAANLDRTESVVSLLGYLQQQSRVRFYLKGEYSNYTFADRSSSFKDSRSYGAYLGVEFVPPAGGYEGETSGMRGGLSLGYMRLDVIEPSQKDYSSLAGNVAISLGIMRFTALRLFFSRNPQFSAYSSLTYYLQTAFGAGLSRSLSRHVVFTYDFSYGLSDYPAVEAAGASPTAATNLRYKTHAFRLSFRLRKDLQLSLVADLGQRDRPSANQPVSHRAFVGFGLTYGNPGGWFSLPTGPMI